MTLHETIRNGWQITVTFYVGGSLRMFFADHDSAMAAFDAINRSQVAVAGQEPCYMTPVQIDHMTGKTLIQPMNLQACDVGKIADYQILRAAQEVIAEFEKAPAGFRA